MARPVWIPLSAVLFCAFACRAGAADAKTPPPASSAPPAAPNPAPAAGGDPSRPVDFAKERVKRPAPLKRLTYSAREGFSLRMVSNQDVTAEIRNGAGRTLARTACTLEAGDWTLRPRNLPPGLYTVLLRTGPQLRSMRMKIEDSERGKGSPEWVLEKAADSTQTPDPTLQRGAALVPVPG
jgi:hypothetical protein